MWKWLAELSPAQATIVGTTLGALLGFGTLTAGALLNAHLNRRRDLYLHRLQQLNLLRSITIEITQISNLVRQQLSVIRSSRAPMMSYSVIDPASLAVVYPNNLSNLNLLPPQAMIRIIPFYVGLAEHEYNAKAHGVTVVSGDSLKSFNFRNEHVDRMMELNERLDQMCNSTLSVCFPIVQAMEKELEGRANKVIGGDLGPLTSGY